MSRLKHVLGAKAVLCPGLHVEFLDEATGEKDEWLYEEGLKDYLLGELREAEILPDEPFTGSLQGNIEAVDWALVWHKVARMLTGYVPA